MRVAAELRPSVEFSRLARDDAFPLMDTSSAVCATARLGDKTLTLAYFLPGCDDSAVVRFSAVKAWFYGAPNDERLYEHALWNKGLDFYEFHQMHPQREDQPRGWLASFHNGTFEIAANGVEIVSPRLVGVCPLGALNRLLGPGENLDLDL